MSAFPHNIQMDLDSSAFVAAPNLLRKLLELAIPLDCTRNRVLFRQGDKPEGLSILRRGEAIMTLESERGDLLIQTQLPPGSILGLPALMSDKPYTMTAVARSGATVGYVSREDFTALMLASPLLAFEALQVLAAEVHTSRTAIAQCLLPIADSSQEPINPELAKSTVN